MFPWNIAKSAEAMFSRWAVKRVCKFLLKKKLGRFILGEIDLDQLDVQLGQGIIQLNDLALNVDYINQKLGEAASLRLKEGSISSLLVKLPWRGQGCQVEVDGLEIIICPCGEKNSKAQEGVSRSSDYSKNLHSKSSTQIERVILDNVEKSTSVDIHEGVKTIAKMVKWLLTSFHVKVRNLILAFDPNLGEEEKKTECLSTLVLRISDIECGTCISEDADTSADILGISRLTNFVKFQGAVIELLNIKGNSQEQALYESGYMHGEPFQEHFLGKATSLIMSGIGDGICGILKVSIPWKNGSLDVGKIDADASIDQMVLRFQPSTIRWILKSLETYNNLKNCKGCVHDKSAEAVCLDSTFFNSSSKGCANDEISVSSSPHSISSVVLLESEAQVLFPESNLISDWLRFSNMRDVVTETDFGASVDQFFECIDGMRSFHSALGSSAMWNWTCSVYSAITAASTLASGSLHIPAEQQHVETNLRVMIAGISFVFMFHDEEQNNISVPQMDKCHGLNVNYLGVECREIHLDLQVCSHAVTVEGKVKYMEVARFFSDEDETLTCGTLEHDTNLNSQTVLIQKLQAKVLDALPASSTYVMDSDSDLLTRLVSVQLPSRYKVGIVKAVLFTTSGVTQGKFMAESNSLDGNFTGSMSFSLNLSSFIFWLDFLVIDMIMSLLEEFRESGRVRDQRDETSSKPAMKKNESSHSDSQEGSGPRLTTLHSGGNFHGDILISNARVILCFPFRRDISYRNLFWDQFVAFDFSLPSTSKNNTSSKGEGLKRCSSTVTRSFCLSFCDLKSYLISYSNNESQRISSYNIQGDRFSAQCFLSVHSKAGYNSVANMLWQDGLVTGPWIAKRAKLLATSEESSARHNFVGKDNEFASANTIQDLDRLKNQIQQDIILSSTFFIHVDLSAIVLNLTPSQYRNVLHLISQMQTGLSRVTSDAVDAPSQSLVSQTSILIESESLEISIGLDKMEDIRSSLQSELPGFWSRMKLEILKFELLSVTNIGGINGAEFFQMTHSEGKLWGSISAYSNQDFLLITCSNSTMKRGDGCGSNALSQRGPGSTIAHLCYPQISRSFTSATVSCATIVAVGGRLDWFDSILSFFSLRSKGIEESVDDGITKEEQKAPPTSFFILNLIDIGLSYEPHTKNLLNHSQILDSESNFTYISEEMTEHVGCLLAASSLALSCSSVGGSSGNDYKIKLHDLGLLLHVVKKFGAYSDNYCVDQLQNAGYVKIAQETLVEATLRTNCASGLLWDVELSRSHFVLETCNDTTASLIHLAAQLQQLFAPDVEESIVHLQTRWDNVQQANRMDDLTDEDGTFRCDMAASTSVACSSNANVKDENKVIGLMDMICEDAFHLDKDRMDQSKFSTSGLYPPHKVGSCVLASKGGIEEPEFFHDDILHNDNAPRIGLETSRASFLEKDCFPEFIEDYFLSDVGPLSDLSFGLQSKEPCGYVPKDGRRYDVGRVGGGWYHDTSIKLIENHIRENDEPNGAEYFDDSLNNGSTNDSNEKACGRLVLNHIDITWKMYGGADWHDSGELGQQSANICGRNTNVLLELALCGLKFHYDLFPVGGVRVSRISLSVRDLHLLDLSRDAPWKMVLGYYHSRDHPRDSSSKAFKLELEAVRPDPHIPLEEYRSRVAFLPIVLHLHQCQLDFLVSFFGATSSSNMQSCKNDEVSDGSKSLPEKSKNLAGHNVSKEALLPYFQKFDIWPIIIRVDYSPSHVDLTALRRGKYVELMNLVPWKGVELHLKHVEAAGIYGWSSVCETVMGEWLEDISQNQIHKIFQGLSPVRSLIAVGSGASKLVSSPVHNYKKEQRVLKGMQRGTLAFLRSISLEAVGLGVHLAAGAHDILLQAEYHLTGVPSSATRMIQDKSKRDVHSNQPRDAQQGIQKACESLGHGLGKSASVLVQNPLKKYQRGSGAGPAFAAAVKAVPAAAIAPASACAGAVHYALLGFRNSLDPERKKESIEKYSPTQP